MPPISSPPPARPGPPVNEMRQRRAVPRGFLRAVPINHDNTPMVRSESQHQTSGNLVISGKHRARETSAATSCQLNGAIDILIGHDGTHRAKGFDRMNSLRLVGVAT